jgi:hypothetical protein
VTAWTHHHACSEPGCPARIGCATRPVRDEDGTYCPLDADGTELLCEEHADMPRCAYCGLRSPALVVDDLGEPMHRACVAEMRQAEPAP